MISWPNRVSFCSDRIDLRKVIKHYGLVERHYFVNLLMMFPPTVSDCLCDHSVFSSWNRFHDHKFKKIDGLRSNAEVLFIVISNL